MDDSKSNIIVNTNSTNANINSSNNNYTSFVDQKKLIMI